MSKSEAHKNLQAAMQHGPDGYFVVVPPVQDEELIDLATLMSVVVRTWKLLVLLTLIGAAIAALISLLMPEIFRSQILVAPVAQSGNGIANGLKDEFGGLAALAGINIGEFGGRKEEYIATLSSAGFARDFITSQSLMPILFAKRWDSQTSAWRKGAKAPVLEEGVKKFTEDVRSITEDRRTGLVTISVEWYSPQLAASWANRMIEMVNERLRGEATRNADRSIEYLNKELAKTGVVEIRQAIFRLIEQQVNNAMLANVQREYAFRVLDPAVPAEIRASPKRTVMTILGAIVGLFIGLIYVVARFRVRVAQTGGSAGRAATDRDAGDRAVRKSLT
jgi:capsular polysaccharide biosynthesis protein